MKSHTQMLTFKFEMTFPMLLLLFFLPKGQSFSIDKLSVKRFALFCEQERKILSSIVVAGYCKRNIISTQGMNYVCVFYFAGFKATMPITNRYLKVRTRNLKLDQQQEKGRKPQGISGNPRIALPTHFLFLSFLPREHFVLRGLDFLCCSSER